MLETREEYRKRTGRVEVGVTLGFRSRGEVIRDLVLAVLLIVAFVGFTLWSTWPSPGKACVAILVFAVYCTIAYFVRARPNHDELGAAAGVLGHPLRRSDNVNRYLLNLAFTLALGRFISIGLVDGIRLLKHGQLPHDRLMQKLDDERHTP